MFWSIDGYNTLKPPLSVYRKVNSLKSVHTLSSLALFSFWSFSFISCQYKSSCDDGVLLKKYSCLSTFKISSPTCRPSSPNTRRSSRTDRRRWILWLASRGRPQQVSLHAFAQSGLARDEPEQRGFSPLTHNHTLVSSQRCEI